MTTLTNQESSQTLNWFITPVKPLTVPLILSHNSRPESQTKAHHTGGLWISEAKGDFERKPNKASSLYMPPGRSAKVRFIIRLTTSLQLAQKRHQSLWRRSAYYESRAFNGEM